MSTAGDYIDQGNLLKKSHPSQPQGLIIRRLIRDREAMVHNVIRGDGVRATFVSLALVSLLALMVVGFTMGLYHSPLQGLYAAIKFPLVFFGATLLCFPVLYILTVMMGANISFGRMLTLAFMALTLGSVLMLLMSPITLLLIFKVTSREFFSLYHTAVVALSCLMTVFYFANILSDVSDETNLYPRHAKWALTVWVTLFGFVGSQLAWVLLPFIGDVNRELEFIRSDHNSTNIFYELKTNMKTIWEKI